MLKKGRIKI